MDRASLLTSIGGVAGIAESVLPSVIFMVAWISTKNSAISIAGALLPVIGFGIYRLVTKSTVMQVLVGALIAGFSAWLALRPGGDTRDYFVSGLVINVSYLVPLLISVLVGRLSESSLVSSSEREQPGAKTRVKCELFQRPHWPCVPYSLSGWQLNYLSTSPIRLQR
jgi:hypothetical protein